MKVIITPEILETAKTKAGGYTRAQLAIIGIDWPPPKGWAKQLHGQELDKELIDQFIAAKEK